MDSSDTTDKHGTRKVREDGSSLAVTIPPEAADSVDIEAGDEVMVTTADGMVVLVPWSASDIAGYVDADE